MRSHLSPQTFASTRPGVCALPSFVRHWDRPKRAVGLLCCKRGPQHAAVYGQRESLRRCSPLLVVCWEGGRHMCATMPACRRARRARSDHCRAHAPTWMGNDGPDAGTDSIRLRQITVQSIIWESRAPGVPPAVRRPQQEESTAATSQERGWPMCWNLQPAACILAWRCRRPSIHRQHITEANAVFADRAVRRRC